MEKSIRQAVILAGGLGTRLRPITLTTPKPMALVNGKPFLEYLIVLLRENGIREVVLLLGYLPEKVIEYFGDGKRFGLNIRYSVTDVNDETGTRLKNVEALLDETFLLMYSDNYWPLQLDILFAFYKKQNILGSVVVYRNNDGVSKNNILVDEHGYVVKYDKSRLDPDLNGVEAGFFILSKSVLQFAPKDNFSFEKEIMPKLIEKKQLAGYITTQRYYSIGSIDRFPATEAFLRPRKIMLLDRDGVINKKPSQADYVKNWEEFIFLPGAIEGLKFLSEKGYELYILTNQPGVARGVMTDDNLQNINKNLTEELSHNGIELQGIYSCVHGWNEGCECRKPKSGLFLHAANEHAFDLRNAIMIGDDPRDVEAATAAGCRSILMKSDGSLLETVQHLAQ